ncbi:MAG: DDE transposase family protein [Cyanobacteria bacterium J06626_26]
MATETSKNSDSLQEAGSWHVVQQPDGHCEIFSQGQLTSATDSPNQWGPFASRSEAIAKRVGLIRAGKCLPQ